MLVCHLHSWLRPGARAAWMAPRGCQRRKLTVIPVRIRAQCGHRVLVDLPRSDGGTSKGFVATHRLRPFPL